MKKLILKSSVLTLVLISILSIPMYAQNTKKLAILNFSSTKKNKAFAEIVRDMLEIQLYKQGNYQILERNQIDAIFREQGFQNSGCIDTRCAVRIGKILAADLVVVGNLRKTKQYIITAKIVDVEKSLLVAGEYITVENENQFESSIKVLTTRMLRNHQEKKQNKHSTISTFMYISTLSHYNSDYRLKNSRFGLHDKALTLGIYRNSTFTQGLQIGIFQCETETDFYSSNSTYKTFWLFPVLFSLGYTFEFNITVATRFKIFPVLSAGATYLHMHQTKELGGPAWDEHFITLLVKPGIMWGFTFNNNLSLMFGVDYMTNFNIDQDLRFILITTGAEYMF